MNGRIYSPKLGRMLSPDPVTQAPETGQNYDRYTYAFNNPLRFWDPSGYEIEEVLVTAQDLSGSGGASLHGLRFGRGFSDNFVAGYDSLDGSLDYLFGDFDHLRDEEGDNVTDDGDLIENWPGDENACADPGNSCTVAQNGNEIILNLRVGGGYSALSDAAYIELIQRPLMEVNSTLQYSSSAVHSDGVQGLVLVGGLAGFAAPVVTVGIAELVTAAGLVNAVDIALTGAELVIEIATGLEHGTPPSPSAFDLGDSYSIEKSKDLDRATDFLKILIP